MELKVGDLYRNRTLAYLVPALAYYGEDFKERFSTVFKLAFGIFDYLLEESHLQGQKNLYILLDREFFDGVVKQFDFYINHFSTKDKIKYVVGTVEERVNTVITEIKKDFE